MITQTGFTWRHSVLLFIVLGSLAWIFSLEPLPQEAAYHEFADRRAVWGIPYGLDVLSNLPFLLVGIAGLRFCLRADLGAAGRAWTVVFAGVAFVSAGSAYYHWSPDNNTLLWDRLPMTIGFMGLVAALAGEYVSERLGALLLVPAVLLGFASVLYWHWADDLRLYYWVQLVPLLSIAAVMVLFEGRYSHQWVLIAALAWYVLAKVAEAYDVALFRNTAETISGHTIKHLLAATGCYSLLWMLQARKPVGTAALA
ncbi:MAG: hypothetical protein WA373_01595 [Burkholderiales bacterium]